MEPFDAILRVVFGRSCSCYAKRATETILDIPHRTSTNHTIEFEHNHTCYSTFYDVLKWRQLARVHPSYSTAPSWSVQDTVAKKIIHAPYTEICRIPSDVIMACANAEIQHIWLLRNLGARDQNKDQVQRSSTLLCGILLHGPVAFFRAPPTAVFIPMTSNSTE